MVSGRVTASVTSRPAAQQPKAASHNEPASMVLVRICIRSVWSSGGRSWCSPSMAGPAVRHRYGLDSGCRVLRSAVAGQGDAAAPGLWVEHRPDGGRVAVDLVGEGLEHGVVGSADQLTVLGGDAVEGTVAEPDRAVGLVVGFVAAGGECQADRGKALVRGAGRCGAAGGRT